MAWSFAVGQLTKDGADDKRMPIEAVVRALSEDLVRAGIAERIANSTFINYSAGYFVINDDGFIEIGEGAA